MYIAPLVANESKIEADM